ncbi:MAG: cyclase family protein [Tindallia sp. MSAO_Bac2]|nr:MAG: cyclase family protein [Tindallia sp. MSAO_Bac2]
MKIVDLSHRITSNMQIYPGDPEVNIEAWDTHEKDGCQVERLCLGSHSGTHIDAPWHFSSQGAAIDEIPLDRFIGMGTIIRVKDKKAGESINREDIDPFTSMIQPGGFLIFNTGWDKYFGTEEYLNHPFLSEEAVKAILGMDISLIGIDTLNIDPTKESIFSGHETLMSRDILIVENLCNLDHVPDAKGTFLFLPLKIDGGDGSPIRAIYLTE